MGVPSCDVISLAEPDRQSDLPLSSTRRMHNIFGEQELVQ